MADTKTSAETDASVLTGAEQVRIVQSALSKKTTAALLGHQFRGAKAKMTGDDTAQNFTTQTVITFDSATIDTDGFWSGGAPTRLTIPAGVTYVELVGQVHVTSSTADTAMTVDIFHYDSSSALQRIFGTRFPSMGATIHVLQACTGPVAVATGDYFTLNVREVTDTSVTLEGNEQQETFLALTVLGMAP